MPTLNMPTINMLTLNTPTIPMPTISMPALKILAFIDLLVVVCVDLLEQLANLLTRHANIAEPEHLCQRSPGPEGIPIYSPGPEGTPIYNPGSEGIPIYSPGPERIPIHSPGPEGIPIYGSNDIASDWNTSRCARRLHTHDIVVMARGVLVLRSVSYSQFTQLLSVSQFTQLSSVSQFTQLSSVSQFTQLSSDSQFTQLSSVSQFTQLSAEVTKYNAYTRETILPASMSYPEGAYVNTIVIKTLKIKHRLRNSIVEGLKHRGNEASKIRRGKRGVAKVLPIHVS